MFEFAPKTPPEALRLNQTVPSNPSIDSDSTALNEKQERKIAKYIERRSKRRARLPLKLAATALAFSSLSSAYWHDVEANRTLAAESQPEIDAIGEHSFNLPSNTSTFYLAGFDTRDGVVFGDRVGVSIQEIIPSNSESIDYGDAPLDPVEIAEQIIGHTGERNLDSIALAGNSLGGIVALEVAEYIILNTDIEIETIILNATPDGSVGLRPGSQNGISAMIDWLKAVPGSRYSTYARYVATMGQENNSYIHSENPIEAVANIVETSEYVWDVVQERRRPGMWLLVDQALAVTNANVENIITNIGTQRGERRMPVIVYLRTTNPDDDQVVRVVESSENICEYAETANLSCEIVHVDGAVHTSYEFDSEAFSAGIAQRDSSIRNEIQQEAAQYALNTYSDSYPNSIRAGENFYIR